MTKCRVLKHENAWHWMPLKLSEIVFSLQFHKVVQQHIMMRLKLFIIDASAVSLTAVNKFFKSSDTSPSYKHRNCFFHLWQCKYWLVMTAWHILLHSRCHQIWQRAIAVVVQEGVFQAFMLTFKTIDSHHYCMCKVVTKAAYPSLDHIIVPSKNTHIKCIYGIFCMPTVHMYCTIVVSSFGENTTGCPKHPVCWPYTSRLTVLFGLPYFTAASCTYIFPHLTWSSASWWLPGLTKHISKFPMSGS